MADFIEDLERRYINPVPAQKYPCAKCGKLVSNRGKRWHDLACNGRAKQAAPRAGGPASRTRSSAPMPRTTFSALKPSSIFSRGFQMWLQLIDYFYRKVSEQTILIVFWLFLLLGSIILPVFLLVQCFVWLNTVYAMVIQIMYFFLNVLGFAVGVSNQSTVLLKAMTSPAFGHAVKYYFDPAYASLGEEKKKEVQKGVTEFTGMISGSLQEVGKAATNSTHMAVISQEAVQKEMSNKDSWYKGLSPYY